MTFRNVGCRFPDGTEALTQVDLHAETGELVAVVGPSGCGKSTLLRIASGLQSPSCGTATVEGSLGYVFQDATLLEWRSVRQNIELGGELAGQDRTTRRRLASEAIDLVGLAGFEHHRPAALSGGMRMRVSIARALTLEPDVFFFDEPFGALDELTRERLNDELLGLFVRRPFAGIFVTHSVYEAVFLASRVVVMTPRPGRIAAEITVPFGYPRAPELRFDPTFNQIAGEVHAALRATHGMATGSLHTVDA